MKHVDRNAAGRLGRSAAYYFRLIAFATAAIIAALLISTHTSKRLFYKQVISSSTRLALPQTWRVDLDTGELAAGEKDDIWFEVTESGERFLTPLRGVKLKIIEGTGQAAATCDDESTFSNSRVPIMRLSPGTGVALRTNQGGCVRMGIVAPVRRSPGTLVFEFQVWTRKLAVFGLAWLGQVQCDTMGI